MTTNGLERLTDEQRKALAATLFTGTPVSEVLESTKYAIRLPGGLQLTEIAAKDYKALNLAGKDFSPEGQIISIDTGLPSVFTDQETALTDDQLVQIEKHIEMAKVNPWAMSWTYAEMLLNEVKRLRGKLNNA